MLAVTACRRPFVLLAAAILLAFPACDSSGPDEPEPEPELDTEAPSVPSGVSATVNEDAIEVNWEASSADDLSEYYVFRGAEPKPTNRVATVNEDSYTDSGVEKGQTYYYRVKAVDSTGNESDFSSGASATRGVLFVDVEATGSNSGGSWRDALTSLQDALRSAEAGVQVWVAKGTYYPDRGATVDENARDVSFHIPKEVSVYGGFSGNETQLSQRDWEQYRTVLSGDLKANDGDNFAGYSDNSCHVVTALSEVSLNTIFDGFSVTGGNATEDCPSFLAQININGYTKGSGAGWYGGAPTIRNVVFIENKGSWPGGGGMFTRGGLSDDKPLLINVTFRNNAKGGYAGPATLRDVVFDGNTGQNALSVGGKEHLKATNVRFYNNSTISNGGAVHVSNSTATLRNAVFDGNTAEGIGGALYVSSSAKVEIIGATFTNNTADHTTEGSSDYAQAGEAVFVRSIKSEVTITNSILWGNGENQDQAGAFAPFDRRFNDFPNMLRINNSIVQGGSPDSEPLPYNPGSNLIGDDPLFVDPASDFRLQSGSPAIDAGSNSLVPSDLSEDLDGNARIVDGDGDGEAVVDMGAYEKQ